MRAAAPFQVGEPKRDRADASNSAVPRDAGFLSRGRDRLQLECFPGMAGNARSAIHALPVQHFTFRCVGPVSESEET